MKNTKVKLYKYIDGNRRLVDYGVMSKVYEYELAGYETEIVVDDKREPIYKPERKPVRKYVAPKMSLWKQIKAFAQSLVPQPAYAYSS